jgi:hypothetical protein
MHGIKQRDARWKSTRTDLEERQRIHDVLLDERAQSLQLHLAVALEVCHQITDEIQLPNKILSPQHLG